jgi:hypothetical protein
MPLLNLAMPHEPFPADFPPELVEAAFVATNEAAWRPLLASVAVEWLAAHGFAVLGTELWLLQDGAIQSLPIGTSGMRGVHGNVVNRGREESWDSYVSRAAAETLFYLRSFNSADIVEAGDVHFNVAWVSEEEFRKLKS